MTAGRCRERMGGVTAVSDDDVAELVAARWDELESVALLATLDPVRARALTAEALALGRAGWGELVAGGRPTAGLHGILLGRLVRGRPSRPDGEPAPVPGAVAATVADDPVATALLTSLAALEPRARAALAAEVVWREPVATVPGAEHLAPEAVQARAVLATVHAAARVAEGLSPDAGRLAPDLDALAARLDAARLPAPDPAGLLAPGRPTTRRALVAAAVALPLGGGAWWAAARSDGTATRTAASDATPTTAEGDPLVWASARTWPARGRLGRTADVQGLVATQAPGGRVLYADDVHGIRVVVAGLVDPAGGRGPLLRLWSGPAGTDAGGLADVALGATSLPDVDDVVVVAAPRGSGAVLLVLTRPDVTVAQYSPYARPTRAGGISRIWRDLALDAGFGTVALGAPLGSALRARCRAYDGPVPAPAAWSEESVASDLAGVRSAVAAATGIPVGRLRADLVRAALPRAVTLGQLPPRRLEVRLVRVVTPDGGVVRCGYLAPFAAADLGASGVRNTVVPATDLDAPIILRVDEAPTPTGQYAVLCPAGGATVQLVGTEGSALSRETALQERAAVLLADGTAMRFGFRVVVRDAAGRTLSARAVPEGRPLSDLVPTGDPDPV